MTDLTAHLTRLRLGRLPGVHAVSERGDGVTLVFGRQVFLTQPPVEDDGKLVALVGYCASEHEKAGKPLSGGKA